jgi:Baseplate J-like protein
MTAPMPDLKPRVPQMAEGSECCGCCDGIEAETPQALQNRDGLSQISYRIGTYAQFRASLHAALSSSAFAPLPQLLTRDNNDFTIGLIDTFACSADVITFYQERIANESWLRTSAERVSLQEMGKLVGYRMRPGVAAETSLAFAIDTPPAPPANLAPEPGNFVTGVPSQLRLEIGTKVQSVPGPGAKPQTFELIEALADARPAWNAMQPWFGEPHIPGRGDTEAWLDGAALNLKAGDALLFVGQEFFDADKTDNWDFRLLTVAEPDNENKRTRIAWARGLGSSLPFSNPARRPHVFVMRKRAAVFGNNAPVWRSMDPQFRAGYAAKFGGAADAGDWSQFVISTNAAGANGGSVDLDQVQPEIAADIPGDLARRSFAILAKGGFNRPDETYPAGTNVELYRVTGTTEVSREGFGLSGKVTRLDIAGEHLDTSFYNHVRETTVYAKSELLALAERPVDTDIAGDRMPVRAVPDGLTAGRRLIIRGKRLKDGQTAVMEAALAAVHIVDNERLELEISPPVPKELVRSSVVIHANVARASHGESVTQILGAGNGSQRFQQFEMKQLPLTYRAAANEIGAAAELSLRVGGIAWAERPSLFGAAPAERAYTLSTDEQGRLSAVFGDGVRGARLPSGVNNVQATYRKGLGEEGNVAADALTQLMTRPLGLKSVSNPLAAEGGTDPETADASRQTIPLTTRTLGRAVSLLDYEDFARAFSGIAKAQAMAIQLRGGMTIAITLAAPKGEPLTPSSPVWKNLLAALKAGGDPHVAVTLLSVKSSTFRLGLRVKRDPAYEAGAVLAAVEAALRTHFAFDSRQLGQPVQESDVIATAQAVAGVTAVDLTRLYGGSGPAFQTVVSQQVRLLADRMHVQAGAAKPAELLTLDPGPFDLLEEMA